MIGTVSALKCYSGARDTTGKSTVVKKDCGDGYDRCGIIKAQGQGTAYECSNQLACQLEISMFPDSSCCQTDYCNTGSSVTTGFAVVSAAIAAYLM